MDKDIKLAKMRQAHEENLEFMRGLRAFMSNPVVELVGAITLVEYLSKHPKDDPVLNLGRVDTWGLKAGITTAVAIQQLGPVLPELVKGSTDIVGSIAKLAPTLAAIA